MNRVPSILEAVDDRHLLGATIEDPAAWRPWRAVLAAAFGLPMDADALALYRECTGREEPPALPIQFLWLVCGRRAGKSCARPKASRRNSSCDPRGRSSPNRR
jgi:hypothetical protein